MTNPNLSNSQFFRIQNYHRAKHCDYNKEVFKLENKKEQKEKPTLVNKILTWIGIRTKQ